MLSVNAEAFLDTFYWFSRIEGIHTQAEGNETLQKQLVDEKIRSETHEGFFENLQKACGSLHAELEKLGARTTQKAVQRLLGKLEAGRLSFDDLGNFCKSINGRLQDELSDITLLTLTAKERDFFAPREPLFGKDFEVKFPSAAFELDEAAKCVALSRATAAVFHFMRIMEIAIRAVARSLGIADPVKPAARNWGAILKAIWIGIEAKWPTAADRMHGDGEVFEAIYASLDAVKNPWRNATMHVENKYTDEEAEHIFAAVRGFMKKLSLRMDENGLPLA